MVDPLLRDTMMICPACGVEFRRIDARKRDSLWVCPMCAKAYDHKAADLQGFKRSVWVAKVFKPQIEAVHQRQVEDNKPPTQE